MGYLLLFAGIVAVLFYFRGAVFNKIDEGNHNHQQIPGRASFIRNTYPGLIEELYSEINGQFLQEHHNRVYITINKNDVIGLYELNGKLFVKILRNNYSVCERNFNKASSNYWIINQITNTYNQI